MNCSARIVSIGFPHHRCKLLRVCRPVALLSKTYCRPKHANSSHRLSRLLRPIKAVSQAAEPKATSSQPRVQQFPLSLTGSHTVTVTIEDVPDQGKHQIVTVSTDAPGKLLLHWGVEGGPRYKGGWRLPGPISRPPGTTEYKKRALQTPFVKFDGQARSGVTLDFPPSEECDAFVFVVKDVSADRWYDFHGSNFRVELGMDAGTNSSTNSSTNSKGTINGSSTLDQLPLADIPPIPSDLAGVWSYMKWEAAGYPARSPEEADEEYRTAIKELTTLLQSRIQLEELQDVAAQGVQRYVDFMDQVKARLPVRQPPPPSPPSPPPPLDHPSNNQIDVPESLVALKAYLMWEAAGKPDGADFGDQARQELSSALRNGASIQDLETQMQQKGDPSESSSPQSPQSPPPPPPPPPSQHQRESATAVGQVVVMKERNPLDLIHRSTAPMLSGSSERRKTHSKAARQKPLSPLVQNAKRDEACVWHRLYPLGSKSELLVAVFRHDSTESNDESSRSLQVTLTTDASADLVLHWGIVRGNSNSHSSQGGWTPPPASILPPGSTPPNTNQEGGGAAESAFLGCDEEECVVEIGGATVPLQRLTISVDAQGIADMLGLLGSNTSGCALSFVIRSADGTRWWKDGGGDFVVPLFLRGASPEPVHSINGAVSQSDEGMDSSTNSTDALDALSSIIVDSEVKSGAWTLMHRFSKAAELVDDIVAGRFDEDPGSEQAMLSIFVWLRYSSIRQLTWQRNYNTQPRILGAAQERLTTALASATSASTLNSEAARNWARLSLTTVGRGGNAQAVRDEILNIMHANKLPELKGTWMEEWHQKLHNNTTPDDVAICEAYLAFLRSDGDLNAYWEALSDAGISRQRLESFDRPITTDPEFFADKKDALIADMSKYLATLKATHSGADLQASAAAAAPWIPRTARGYLGHVMASHGSRSSDTSISGISGSQSTSAASIVPLIVAAVEARTELAPLLRPPSCEGDEDNNGLDVKARRELLYLDIALENVVRGAAEQGARTLPVNGPAGAAALLGPLLQNLALSMADNEEVCYCLKAWHDVGGAMGGNDYFADDVDQDAALKAMATVDRIKRALATASDATYKSVAPVASTLGTRFGCEPWAVQLFPDEVVRGGPAFGVSLVLSTVEPWLRSAASLGAWQIISPVGEVRGMLVHVASLNPEDGDGGGDDNNDNTIGDSIDYGNEPNRILLADRVGGEEEVPPGTVGVISSDAPDVLSHLAVRARNLKVLFAACHDRDVLKELAQESGKYVSIKTTAAGDVSWQVLGAGESFQESSGSSSGSGTSSSSMEYSSGGGGGGGGGLLETPKENGSDAPPAWVVGMDEFEKGLVGGKSLNLAILSNLLPSGVRVPPSVTVPFGVMESVLDCPENSDIKQALTAGLRSMSHRREKRRDVLAECRRLVMDLVLPPAVKTVISKAIRNANISQSESQNESWWEALKAVWASKYNERAAISARHHGIDFTAVNMAVLVQRIIPARYAFVIHTINPTNGNENEIYCEIVCGLGEAIVSGNVPGTAMACTARKDALSESPPTVLFYPSKSEGMFVPEEHEADVLIFRSDSNGEDLEGYAGAGLYDSVLTKASVLRTVDYAADPLVADAGFRDQLLTRICKVGMEIEKAFGAPQDVEGVVDSNLEITIVQTRPQV